MKKVNSFSYDEYMEIIERIKKNYDIVDFLDVEENDIRDGYCVIRHDVEFSLDRAYKLACIEYELGIESSYMIQIRNNNYNPFSNKNLQLIEKIVSFGHHIGLHVYSGGHKFYPDEELEQYIENDMDVLCGMTREPIDRFCYHRPTKNQLENNIYVQDKINTYGSRYFKYVDNINELQNGDVLFLSDSNHRWKWGYPDELKFKGHTKMQLLCHPYSWSEKGYDNKNNLTNIINEKHNETISSMKEELVSFETL